MLGWDLDGYAERASRRSAGTRSRSTATTSRRSRRPTPRPRRTATGRPRSSPARRRARASRPSRTSPASTASRSTTREAAIAELGGERDLTVEVANARRTARAAPLRRAGRRGCRRWELGDEVATRKAYGEALAALGDVRGDVVALDGEVSNSTHSEDFREAHPDRYFEMFIAEQQLVAAAVGMQVRGWVPFASTFAAFFSRAYDFVRMAAVISRATSGCAARTPASRSARTGRRRWRSRTWPRSARSRLDRAAPVRRQPDGQARRGDGRPDGHLVPAHAARQDAGAHAAGRDVRDRRQPRGPRRRRRRDRGLRHHARRGGRGGRAARPRRHRGARDRRLLDQADRRGDARAPRRPSAARSSPSRTTGPRAASATPCSRRSRRAASAPRCEARGARDARLGHAGRAAARGRHRRRRDRARRARAGGRREASRERESAAPDRGARPVDLDRQPEPRAARRGGLQRPDRGGRDERRDVEPDDLREGHGRVGAVRRRLPRGSARRRTTRRRSSSCSPTGTCATPRDLLRPTFEATAGADGYVSFELPASVANDAKRLDRGGTPPSRSDRPRQRADQGSRHARPASAPSRS